MQDPGPAPRPAAWGCGTKPLLCRVGSGAAPHAAGRASQHPHLEPRSLVCVPQTWHAPPARVSGVGGGCHRHCHPADGQSASRECSPLCPPPPPPPCTPRQAFRGALSRPAGCGAAKPSWVMRGPANRAGKGCAAAVKCRRLRAPSSPLLLGSSTACPAPSQPGMCPRSSAGGHRPRSECAGQCSHTYAAAC